jgi:ketosteroid isomerase-like protein
MRNEMGRFSMRRARSGPSALKPRVRRRKVTGKYLVVWAKIGNDWKLAADIWNDGK